MPNCRECLHDEMCFSTHTGDSPACCDFLDAARYHEIMQAEREGRLVILPCKVGDTVYQIIRAKDGHGFYRPVTVGGLHLGDTTRNRRFQKEKQYFVLKVDGGFCAHLDIKEIGKTVFLSRSEAEKALEEAKCD